MKARGYQKIIDTADCISEVNYVGEDRQLKVMGWAKRLIEASFEAGKAECAKTHFKPDWKLKAQDIKDATEEGYKAGKQEGRKEVVERWLKQLKEWGL